MFRDLKPYPEYAEPRSPWIPAFPSTWSVAPGAGVLQEVRAKNYGLRETTVLSLSYGRVIVKSNDKLHGLVPASFEGYQILEPGDIVIRPTDLQNDQTSLRVGEVQNRGIITSAYIGLRPRHIDNRFAFLYLKALDHTKVFYGMGSGLRQNLDFSDFKRLPVPIPSVEEQQAIVTYLVHAHQRINQAIATKRRLVSLLEEARRAIVEEAFGDLSARDHTRLKYVAAVQTGLTLGKDYGAAKTRAYPYLRVANVQAGSLAVDKVTEVQVPEAEAARCTLQKGDLLMTEGGDIDKLGRGTIWNGEVEDCLHQNHVFAVRCSEAIDPRFLEAFLRHSAARTYFFRTAKKTTNLAATNSTTLGNLVIPLFSRTEQTAVVDLVDSRAARVDQQIGAARREVQLLEEYRCRLTSDVVTGQLDVRAAAANLPEIDSGSVFATSSDGTSEDDDEALDSDAQGGT